MSRSAVSFEHFASLAYFDVFKKPSKLPSNVPLLARRIATLQLQIHSEFPIAEDLRQSPDLAERVETTPVKLAAAAALQALDDLADELATKSAPPHHDTLNSHDFDTNF